jgi:hypothetical protein
MRVIVEVILADAEGAGKIFIDGKPAGLIREYDLKLSDDKTEAAIQTLNWERLIREEIVHFRFRYKT